MRVSGLNIRRVVTVSYSRKRITVTLMIIYRYIIVRRASIMRRAAMKCHLQLRDRVAVSLITDGHANIWTGNTRTDYAPIIRDAFTW